MEEIFQQIRVSRNSKNNEINELRLLNEELVNFKRKQTEELSKHETKKCLKRG